MQLLEAILLKNQQLQRNGPSRGLKAQGSTVLYSQIHKVQTPNHFRSQSCRLKNSQYLGHKHEQFNYSALQPLNSKKRKQRKQPNITVTTATATKDINNFCSSSDISHNIKSFHNPQFFVTIYSNNKDHNFCPSRTNYHSPGHFQKKSHQSLEIQVNKLPIIRKKQSKRRILAEAFKLRAQMTPQIAKPVRSFPRAYQPPPELLKKNRIGQNNQISGWEDIDLFE